MNTTVWLIRYTNDGDCYTFATTSKVEAEHFATTHNATVKPIDCAAVDKLVTAAHAVSDAPTASLDQLHAIARLTEALDGFGSAS